MNKQKLMGWRRVLAFVGAIAACALALQAQAQTVVESVSSSIQGGAATNWSVSRPGNTGRRRPQ